MRLADVDLVERLARRLRLRSTSAGDGGLSHSLDGARPLAQRREARDSGVEAGEHGAGVAT